MRNFIVVIGLTLAACASVGRPIPWTEVQAKLEPGKSRYEDAVAVLGQPYRTTSGTSNAVSCVWTYSHASAFGGTYAESIRLEFDERGFLRAMPKPPPNRQHD